jgi:ubiquinone/menaquinone biosynthesis C-methylase UbiE
MNQEKLHEAIDAIDKIGDLNWRNNLNNRKLKELEFHDLDRDMDLKKEIIQDVENYNELFGNKKYYSTVRRSRFFVQEWIKKNSKDKVFLDYACGEGENAITAAKAGASLSLGFDISSVSVTNARNEAAKDNLQNVRFFQADAENTALPDACVDVILCSGMLHHLDLSYAFPEMRRILKPGGRILAVEALDINPFIKIYRARTPKMRTEWEAKHILSLKEVTFAQRFFVLKEIRFWHVIGYVAGKFPSLLRPLEKVDVLMEKIPYLQRFAWIFTFELVKEEK